MGFAGAEARHPEWARPGSAKRTRRRPAAFVKIVLRPSSIRCRLPGMVWGKRRLAASMRSSRNAPSLARYVTVKVIVADPSATSEGQL